MVKGSKQRRKRESLKPFAPHDDLEEEWARRDFLPFSFSPGGAKRAGERE